ncbi:MAG: type III pantothenate kinase [Actinobacteria bacterium]|nr:type III pantothenate kinase [Actinomycetota bacterium]
MLLAIDVGNTQTVIGIFEDKELISSWRISTDADKTADELIIILSDFLSLKNFSLSGIKAVAISSVVPHSTMALEDLTRRYFGFEPLVIGPGVKTGISIQYDNPREVGADRIVNAVAAYEAYGGPLIIVDFGTAATFCAVSKNGEYLGGAIAPGIEISSDALFNKAARLSRVDLQKPKTVIGKNTVSSLQSGIIYGFAGQVDAIVSRMKEEMGGKVKEVIATGGLMELVVDECKQITKRDPLLTLNGLKIIWERNVDDICR